MANCHDRGGVTACVLYKDQFRKKKGDTKYNYPFRSFKSHLLLLLVPACSTYAQPAVRSLYQPLIRPCDISSKSDLSMEGGGKYTGYEFFFRYFLGTKYQVLDALRKSTSAGPQCLFLRTHAGIFDVSTCAGAWCLPHCVV